MHNLPDNSVPHALEPLAENHQDSGPQRRAGIPGKLLSVSPVQPALLDLTGAAALCSLSVPAFRRLYRSRSIPAPLRLGRKLRWRTADLLAWIDGGCRAVDAASAADYRRRHREELAALAK
jgi:predicted DNA-binding transcriptional regulator AlpA